MSFGEWKMRTETKQWKIVHLLKSFFDSGKIANFDQKTTCYKVIDQFSYIFWTNGLSSTVKSTYIHASLNKGNDITSNAHVYRFWSMGCYSTRMASKICIWKKINKYKCKIPKESNSDVIWMKWLVLMEISCWFGACLCMVFVEFSKGKSMNGLMFFKWWVAQRNFDGAYSKWNSSLSLSLYFSVSFFLSRCICSGASEVSQLEEQILHKLNHHNITKGVFFRSHKHIYAKGIE